MKKSLIFTLLMAVVMLFTVAGSTFAVEGTLGEIEDTISINSEVGPYASVEAHKLEYDHTDYLWIWPGISIPKDNYWGEVEPGMDFGFFSGNPDQQSKVRDTNCFIVETNTALNVTFDGQPLTYQNDPNITLPTTYWAFTSWGVDENTWPLPTWELFPDQIQPFQEIGYFGETEIPENNLSHEEYPNFVQDVLSNLVGSIWPGNSVPSQQIYNGITQKGIYAFQVFGFAGMGDNISSQHAGQYTGEIRLTVATAE